MATQLLLKDLSVRFLIWYHQHTAGQHLFYPYDLFFDLARCLSFSVIFSKISCTKKFEIIKIKIYKCLKGCWAVPNHQGTEGVQGRGLSPSPSTLSLLSLACRLWPGLLLRASACGSTTTTTKTHIIRGQIPLLLCLIAFSISLFPLFWGPVWSGWSLWKLSDVWHPLHWGAVTEQGERCTSVRGVDSSTNPQQHFLLHQRSPQPSAKLSVYW